MDTKGDVRHDPLRNMIRILSIPLALLVFIQALVIMFVAAPGLIRALYRFDETRVGRRGGPAAGSEGTAA